MPYILPRILISTDKSPMFFSAWKHTFSLAVYNIFKLFLDYFYVTWILGSLGLFVFFLFVYSSLCFWQENMRFLYLHRLHMLSCHLTVVCCIKLYHKLAFILLWSKWILFHCLLLRLTMMTGCCRIYSSLPDLVWLVSEKVQLWMENLKLWSSPSIFSETPIGEFFPPW